MVLNPEQVLLFSDDALLVVNKPSGVLTLPDGYDREKPHLRSILEPSYGRLWIVHRLDRGTSGVILLARSAEAHRHLNTQFQENTVKKVYHGLVQGNPPWESITVEEPLCPDGDRRHRTIIDPINGKPSITDLRALHSYEAYSLLEAKPKTGRTHQIRAHLRHAGYPILGDPLYGDPSHPSHTLLSRLGLHARSLTLVHPETEETIQLEAPYHEDFSKLLGA